MGIFDAIKESFDSYTTEQFNDLYKNHYKALYLYIYGGYKHPKNKLLEVRMKYIHLSIDMPYDTKKTLVKAKEYIISRYEEEIKYEKALTILSKYPNGTTIVYYKEFNITITDAPEIAKKALSEYKKQYPDWLLNLQRPKRRKIPYNETMENILYFCDNILNKEAEIKEEEAKLQAIVAQWQKEADDKIISNAKYLAVVYPNAYKKLINFPIQTMNLVQAKKTLEYENQIKQYERALKEKESMPLRVRQAVSSWHTIKGIPYYP